MVGMVDLPLRGINFDSTYPPQVKTALRSRTVFGGGWWIRTTEGIASRFTVCPLWPLGKSPKYTGIQLELVDGFEPPTC